MDLVIENLGPTSVKLNGNLRRQLVLLCLNPQFVDFWNRADLHEKIDQTCCSTAQRNTKSKVHCWNWHLQPWITRICRRDWRRKKGRHAQIWLQLMWETMCVPKTVFAGPSYLSCCCIWPWWALGLVIVVTYNFIMFRMHWNSLHCTVCFFTTLTINHK